MSEGKFWMVYCEGGSSPKQKHETINDAIEEARRITQKEGKAAYVLGCVGYCEIPTPEPVFKLVDDPNQQQQYGRLVGSIIGDAARIYGKAK